jgi:hypothetical protein
VLIDCDTCQVRGPACGDCVVTVLLGPHGEARSSPEGWELDGAERAAIAVLADSGLVPPLRLIPGKSTHRDENVKTGPIEEQVS